MPWSLSLSLFSLMYKGAPSYEQNLSVLLSQGLCMGTAAILSFYRLARRCYPHISGRKEVLAELFLSATSDLGLGTSPTAK